METGTRPEKQFGLTSTIPKLSYATLIYLELPLKLRRMSTSPVRMRQRVRLPPRAPFRKITKDTLGSRVKVDFGVLGVVLKLGTSLLIQHLGAIQYAASFTISRTSSRAEQRPRNAQITVRFRGTAPSPHSTVAMHSPCKRATEVRSLVWAPSWRQDVQMSKV